MIKKILAKDWPKDCVTPLDVWRVLPLCGCGAPEEALEVILWLLSSQGFEGPYEARAQFHDYADEHLGGFYWLALYTLADKELTEHGGNVRAGWLTDRGRAALRYLLIFGTEPDLWPEGEVCSDSGNYYEVTEEQVAALFSS
jgi:hypothetical protein